MGENIALFVPNIIGYVRLLFAAVAFIGFYHPTIFILFYSLSYLLDATDGHYARKLHQATQFGALLDMITDRICTITLLVLLSHIYSTMKFYFIFMAMLDMASHWLQMTSSIVTGATSHKGKAKGENFLVSLYYKSQVVLFLMVFGAEAFNVILYINKFFPGTLTIAPIKWLFVVSASVFHLKQIISVAQLFGSLKRYVTFSQEKIKGQ
jgi:CDP-diacylglycerol--inositol 3-phosphatidyltransferase